LVLEEPVRDGLPRLRKIWGDCGYSGEKLISWVAGLRTENPVELEIVPRKKQQQGFEVLPWRWIVERTFGWLGRYSPDEQGVRHAAGHDRGVHPHRHDQAHARASHDMPAVLATASC
jgi:transposase